MSKEPKHTPPPWVVQDWSKDMRVVGNLHVIVGADGTPPAFVPAWDRPAPGEVDGTDEARANARLIAAAPEMYEALEEVIRKCEQFKNNGANANDYRHVQSIAETARAALIEYREMSR